LRKLRGKSLVERIVKTRRYRVRRHDIRTLAALLILREQISLIFRSVNRILIKLLPVLYSRLRPRRLRAMRSRSYSLSGGFFITSISAGDKFSKFLTLHHVSNP
jgi:hypothetical protein